MSNSQRPHGLQPTRLLRPWDFPGKSTGMGCHCLLRCFLLLLLKCTILISYLLPSLLLLLLSCFSCVQLCATPLVVEIWNIFLAEYSRHRRGRKSSRDRNCLPTLHGHFSSTGKVFLSLNSFQKAQTCDGLKYCHLM